MRLEKEFFVKIKGEHMHTVLSLAQRKHNKRWLSNLIHILNNKTTNV